jgi:hypothetical protein
MTTESEFDLDKLFLPKWAQESPSFNKYAGHSGDDRGPRRGDRDDRGDRRGGPRPARRDFSAPGGKGFNPPTERRPGGGGREGGDRGRGRGFQRGDRRDERPRREFVPLPEIRVELLPDEKGVESLARQIKMTGRAYPLFEIAKIILQKPERQQVHFEVVKRDDKILQPLILCLIDDTLWLTEQEAVTHVLDKHFEMFYTAEKTPTDPPKGVFTFVGQCGISGTVLGPPNYHDYQVKLRKLHQERFANMPFEVYKSRVKIVRDEATVKKWLDDQSWKTEFVTLNVPEADVKRLQNRESVEQHFREVHLQNIVKEVEHHTLSGAAGRKIPMGQLQRVVRRAWEEQQRFPLKLVNHLSQQFASRGLQFFKVNKHVTHVAVARPHYLDLEATPVSDMVKKIVDFINAHSKCTRRDLIEGLSPSVAAPKPTEGQPATQAEPTAEQTAIIGDLHWLVHQGHVIEFANGVLETAKKPKPRPEPKKKEPVLPGATAEKVPNESVETIEPRVAELEAARPGEAQPAAQATETESASAVPEFSEAEVADLQESTEENLGSSEEAAPAEQKPGEPAV